MKPFNCFLNRLKLAGSYYGKVPCIPGKPSHLKIELTNYCNLSCPICPHYKMERKTGFMNFSLYKDIIDQTHSFVEFIYLHFMGESLFHRDIEHIIKYGKQKGIPLGLSTNATILDKKMSEMLINSDLDFLVISFDGLNKSSYEATRKNSSYETTVENIKNFFRVKNGNSNLTAVIQSLKIDETDEEVRDIVNKWQQQEYIMIKKPKDWAGSLDWLSSSNGQEVTRPCSIPWNELSVLWDGSVVICSNDYDGKNIVGDVNRSTIMEIWNNDKMRYIRDCHLKSKTSGLLPCSKCSGYGLNFFSYIKNNQFDLRKLTYLNKDTNVRGGIS